MREDDVRGQSSRHTVVHLKNNYYGRMSALNISKNCLLLELNDIRPCAALTATFARGFVSSLWILIEL